MKNFLLFCLCVIFSVFSVYAQEPVGEPEFVGEALMLFPDNTAKLLEKTTSNERTRLNAAALVVGIGKAKTKIVIDGESARVRIPQEGDYKLIIRAVDNSTDPLSIISVFRFDVKKNSRTAEVSSVNSFGSVSRNNLEYLPFSAKKYGESSYILTLEEKPAGEYGIIVRNPNSLDEKATIVSTFAIE
ncbi:MAG TPA: hypothetical protein IAA79_03675 [Candidatus Avirikenella pullistercoris]|nr:hypothetical protein [Candidatus Avirikenella pullistercoris]